MPTIDEARERALTRRQEVLSRANARRATPDTSLAPVVVVEPYVGPPLDPNLEETLQQNPGLGALIMSLNPGVPIPGVSMPPREPAAPGEARPHYLDGKNDVALLAASPPHALTGKPRGQLFAPEAFRAGGIFAPTPGADSQNVNISSPELATLVGLIHQTNAARPENAATPNAPSAAPKAYPLATVDARQIQVLAHLGVGKTLDLGGVVVLERVDVATYAVRAGAELARLQESHEKLSRLANEARLEIERLREEIEWLTSAADSASSATSDPILKNGCEGSSDDSQAVQG